MRALFNTLHLHCIMCEKKKFGDDYHQPSEPKYLAFSCVPEYWNERETERDEKSAKMKISMKWVDVIKLNRTGYFRYTDTVYAVCPRMAPFSSNIYFDLSIFIAVYQWKTRDIEKEREERSSHKDHRTQTIHANLKWCLNTERFTDLKRNPEKKAKSEWRRIIGYKRYRKYV